MTVTVENQNTRRETCCQCHLFTTRATCTGLGSNLCLRCERPANDRPSGKNSRLPAEPVAGAVSSVKAEPVAGAVSSVKTEPVAGAVSSVKVDEMQTRCLI